MSAMAVLTNLPSLRPIKQSASEFRKRRRFNVPTGLGLRIAVFSRQQNKLTSVPHSFQPSTFRIRSFQPDDAENYEATRSIDASEGQDKVANEVFENRDKKGTGSSFLAKLALVLGIIATVTVVSVGLKQTNQGSLLGIQYLPDGPSYSTIATPADGFTFKAFGYRFLLPQYAPGWIYFWLLMAAGCGLFISEEALNIWVGIDLARMLSLDGTWQSFVESFFRNAPYIISTVLWVYWGVCISDMVPFYLGKLFRRSGASDDACSKLGIGKEKAMSITRAVQRYGNLVGFAERFSLGVRNPTAFVAGALDISPECFFAGVCCGGLITLPLQLGIGFLLRERPVFALATVATVVVWSMDSVPICSSCFISIISLFKTPLLQLGLRKLLLWWDGTYLQAGCFLQLLIWGSTDTQWY
ncbi:hypothetical protein RJ639_010228 [Escallonia herrerae]|uniref:VTT domain-containing protein n=1 Tax=Escallonia herrerae TaxID=1293975 RepID=A0AA88VQD2_9ASTE|nr:hypothetical protein RJ639_010228 [Escallonia herrerae]